jgi:hypothetical protein
MSDGPGTKREPYLVLNDKWGVRLVRARVGRSLSEEWLFWYLDGPFDGVDDGSLDDIFPWERYADSRPLFLFGDYPGVPSSWQGQPVFKQSCDKNTPFIPFFYSVRLDIAPRQIMECDFDLGFIGAARTHPCRSRLRRCVQHVANSYFCDNGSCWWAFSDQQRALLRQGYLALTENTKFVLCPRGKGLNSIRFFETLRLGRIPVLVSDDTKLPLEEKIEYDQFMVRVPEDEAGRADHYVSQWAESHDLVSASVEARKVSLEHFEDPERFVATCLRSSNLEL